MGGILNQLRPCSTAIGLKRPKILGKPEVMDGENSPEGWLSGKPQRPKFFIH